MAKLNRNSTDPQERIEWQLNQIRQSVAIVAALFILGVLGTLLLAGSY